MTITIRDREAGNIIEECKTVKEAIETVKEYEANDKAEGIYVKNFYEIVKETYPVWEMWN